MRVEGRGEKQRMRIEIIHLLMYTIKKVPFAKASPISIFVLPSAPAYTIARATEIENGESITNEPDGPLSRSNFNANSACVIVRSLK